MDKTSSTEQSERWASLKQEALAVLSVAGSLTAALWIKRLIERLTHSKVIDPTVVREGLKTIPPAPPQASPQQERDLPGFRGSNTSSRYSSLHRQQRSGPGRVFVDGVGSIVYRAKVQTSDGYTLYDHDNELNHFHVGPCPLLRADETCDNCEWHVDDGHYRWEPKCAALVKLHEEPREDMSLHAVRSHLEASL